MSGSPPSTTPSAPKAPSTTSPTTLSISSSRANPIAPDLSRSCPARMGRAARDPGGGYQRHPGPEKPILRDSTSSAFRSRPVDSAGVVKNRNPGGFSPRLGQRLRRCPKVPQALPRYRFARRESTEENQQPTSHLRGGMIARNRGPIVVTTDTGAMPGSRDQESIPFGI